MIVGSSDIASKQIPFITMMLILANVCMFTKSYMLEVQAARESQANYMDVIKGNDYSTENEDAAIEFFDQYGFQMSDFENGEYYSLLSHMFVHGGIMHLLGNMLALWAFAVTLEELYGMGVFTGVYFVCGLAACLSQGLYDMNATIPMVGASGAIAGILGAYCITFGSRAKVKFLYYFLGFHIIEIPASLFAVLWIGLQVVCFSTGGGTSGGVAIVAHLGGCGAGLALGYFFKSEVEARVDTDREGNLVIASAKPKPVSEAKLLEDILECQPFTQVVATLGDTNIACPKCGTTLDMHHPVGERLVRCHNDACIHMTYVDGYLLASQMHEAQTETQTV
jgi:membrane associated rhomboid family serine protease